MSKLTYLDIETSMNVGYFWRPGYKVNISHDSIKQERVILCAAWAHDDGEVQYTDELYVNEDGSLDDSAICETLVDALEESTVLVHHNGDKFDIPWINGRCLHNGVGRIGTKRSLDTYKITKKLYNLNSYRLDYLAKFLGVGRKVKSSYQWWVDIIEQNEDAAESFDQMVHYNIVDVEVLRDVFKLIEPDISYNWYTILEDPKTDACRGCGTVGQFQSRGIVPNQSTGYERYTCKVCGTWHRGSNKKALRRKL